VRVPFTALLLLLPALAGATGSAATAGSTVFTQTVEALDPAALPPVQLRVDDFSGFRTVDFPLGRGRLLRLRTDLPADRDAGLASVADRVRRCYDHVERATGRTVRGGVLLYLPAFRDPPATYAFRAEVADRTRWSQVRLALLDVDDPRCATPADPALADLLLDTLPHDLGHELLAAAPTIRHDLSDGRGRGTRWFEEGVCEVLAKSFAAAEDPAAYGRLLAQRNVDQVMDRGGVRAELLGWSEHAPLPPSLESDLYGAAFLTVRRWTDAVPLAHLLDRLNRAGGDRDGHDLLEMLQRDLGTNLLGVLDDAAALGRSLPRG